MKKITLKLFYIAILAFNYTLFAQVGIGTTSPKAALDVQATSNNYGLLLPRVALTATNVAAPVTNPAGGALIVGTVVFNTATTTGTYGVIPGIYFWDGVNWISNIHRYYSKNFLQNADLNVGKSLTTFTNIPGLTGQTFTAPYEGEYQIIFTGYLGCTKVSDNTANLPVGSDISGYSGTAYVEGFFRLNVNGTNYDRYCHSASYYVSGTSNTGGGGNDMFELFNEVNIIVNIYLTAGATCTLNASYRGDGEINAQTTTPHVVGSISSALANKSEINVTYIGR
ncbi:MAG: hypothetical protein QM535_00920 [Limnohabitans sp.]|nr:hypothetical protein [Limnohabitans sp.]